MKYLFALLLAMVAGHASATHCTNGLPDSYYPACIPPVTTPVSPVVQGQQDQQQGQGQQQGQAAIAGARASLNSRNSADGNGSGNSTVQQVYTGNAPGSGDTYKSLSVGLPSPAPAIAPTMVAGAVTMVSMGCGPLVREEATPVMAYETGLFGQVNERQIGINIAYRPYLGEDGLEQPYKMIQGQWYGHEILREAAVLSVSSGGSLGGALFNQRGGGSASVAASAGLTSMAGQTMYRLCALPMPKPQPIVFEERRYTPPPPVRRKPVVRKAAPCPTEDKVVKVCKRL